MPISTVSVGDFVYTSKLNELIATLNQLSLSAVNFVGSTGSIRQATGDIASVTRLSPGVYRINFTELRESPYVPVACCTFVPGNDTGYFQLIEIAPGYFIVQTATDDGPAANDPSICCAIVLG